MRCPASPIPAGAIPVDLAISPAGDLLVADNGPAQQILVYAASTSGQRSLTTEIGTLDELIVEFRHYPPQSMRNA